MLELGPQSGLIGDAEQHHGESGKLIPKRSYGMVMHRGKYLSGQARAFLDVAEQSSLPNSPWRIAHS